MQIRYGIDGQPTNLPSQMIKPDGIRAEGLNGNEMIYVYTTNGVLVAKQIAENTIENISLTGKGIYVVNIVSTGASQAFKVVK